jgi:hypothetical protein
MADVSALMRTLARQSNVILSVSARIAYLEAISQVIADKFKNLNHGQPFSDVVTGAES